MSGYPESVRIERERETVGEMVMCSNMFRLSKPSQTGHYSSCLTEQAIPAVVV